MTTPRNQTSESLKQAMHQNRATMSLPTLNEVQTNLNGSHPRFWDYVQAALIGTISKLGIGLTPQERKDRMQYAIDQAQICCQMESEHLAAYQPGENAGSRNTLHDK